MSRGQAELTGLGFKGSGCDHEGLGKLEAKLQILKVAPVTLKINFHGSLMTSRHPWVSFMRGAISLKKEILV